MVALSLSRPWKVLVPIAAVIVASGLAGGLIGHRLARQRIETRNDPATWNEHVSREFDRIVKPDPEQAARIQAHLDRAVQDLQAIRAETIARSSNVIWRLVGEVERDLTPEQRKAFEAMKPKPSDFTLDVLKVKPPSGRAR